MVIGEMIVLCFNLSDEVKADDYLTAFVYKDEKCTDAYTKFAKKAYKTMAGSSVTIQEYKASYDRHYNVVFDTSNKENLRVYDSNFKLISEDNYSIYRDILLPRQISGIIIISHSIKIFPESFML